MCAPAPSLSPGADVGESRRRCGRVAAQMWASRGADVGESRRRCGPALHASCCAAQCLRCNARVVDKCRRTRAPARACGRVSQCNLDHGTSQAAAQRSTAVAGRIARACRAVISQHEACRRAVARRRCWHFQRASHGQADARRGGWSGSDPERVGAAAAGRLLHSGTPGGSRVCHMPHLHRDRAHRCHIFTGTGMRRPGGRPLASDRRDAADCV